MGSGAQAERIPGAPCGCGVQIPSRRWPCGHTSVVGPQRKTLAPGVWVFRLDSRARRLKPGRGHTRQRAHAGRWDCGIDEIAARVVVAATRSSHSHSVGARRAFPHGEGNGGTFRQSGQTAISLCTDPRACLCIYLYRAAAPAALTPHQRGTRRTHLTTRGRVGVGRGDNTAQPSRGA